MRSPTSVAAWVAILAVVAAPASGQLLDLPLPGTPATGGGPAAVSASAESSVRVAAPGQRLYLAVEVTLPPGFWLYGPAPGGQIVKPLPLTVTVEAPGLEVQPALFLPTQPHQTSYPDGAVDIHQTYQPSTVVFVPLAVASDAAAGPRRVTATLAGQMCSDTGACVPVDAAAAAELAVGPAAVAAHAWADRFDAMLARAAAPSPIVAGPAAVANGGPMRSLTVWAGLGLALLAGLALNVMPCVLPVIPLKVLALARHAHHSRRRYVKMSLIFVAGMLLFFAVLALVSAALRIFLSHTFNWGDHFREPAFVIAMVLVLVAMACNLFGLFTVLVPARITQAEAHAEESERPSAALGMGFLTATLATPCSFGILASAVAWAQAQPLWLGSLAILLIGVGMAGPFLVMTPFPQLAQRFPRGGRWTELFERTMGFVLLLVAAFLLGAMMETEYPARVLAYAVILALCLWIWGSWVRWDSAPARKLVVRGFAAALAAVAGVWLLAAPAAPTIPMVPFDAAALESSRAQGRIVVVEFTARWCVNCKFVEARVYGSSRLAEAFRRRNVRAMKADTSLKTSPAAEFLKASFPGVGVPLTVVYPPGTAAPIRLEGLFAVEDLLSALDRAASAP